MVMESSAEYLAGTNAVSVTDPSTIVNHLSWMKWERQENLVVVTLDNANHIINKHIVTKGLVNEGPFHPREILRHAILDNAVRIIVAHNHPSGNSEPSEEDIAVTRIINAACKIMKIPCLDHIVISRSGFTSICRMHPELFEI
jgi:DNA repair protein RadC